MKNKYILFLLLALTWLASNPVHAAKSDGYWYDTTGNIVRSGVGECVRSNQWAPSNALPECEGKMTKKVTKAKPTKEVTHAKPIKQVAAVKMTKKVTKSVVAKKSAKSDGYWYDTSGNVVRSGVGECVRSNQWSSSNALPECEGGMTKKIAKVETPIVVAKIGIDSDNDGVLDSRDRCKGTGIGIKVTADGCKVIVKVADADNDLVADSMDKCKGTLAGVKVGADGCDLNKDTDNDGIADAGDNCLGSVAGTIVDKHGCALETDISLNYVKFNFGVATLNSNSEKVLDGIANTLKENKHLRFEVAGHTDNSGNHQFNLNLSSNRAQSVRQYLIEKGVAPERLITHGYGPNKPIAPNNTRQGRIENRRVELMSQR